MNITAKDVGREVVDEIGNSWLIVHFTEGTTRPIVARCLNSANTFSSDGVPNQIFYSHKLIRFADEPSAEPPEFIDVKFADENSVAEFSRPFIYGSASGPRPDLAGTTWRYSKPERVK